MQAAEPRIGIQLGGASAGGFGSFGWALAGCFGWALNALALALDLDLVLYTVPAVPGLGIKQMS